MKCARCQGFLVRDHFLDFDGTIGHMWANGYRCMNCGNVHDPVIEQHRLARKHKAGKDELIPEAQTITMRAA